VIALAGLAAFNAAIAFAIDWSSGFPAAPPYSVVALVWIAGAITLGLIVKILWRAGVNSPELMNFIDRILGR
jgi:hypothetical protein